MIDLVQGLNPQQAEAVIHEGSPLLILAGAGSGKTKVLTHRIANFVQNKKISSQQILGVTFTNKAAKEMKERIKKLVGKDAEFPYLGTFHSISVRILKVEGHHIGLEPTFTIYDSNDQKDIIKEAMKNLNIDPKSFNPNAVHSAISSAKNDLIFAEEYGHHVSDIFTENVAKVYKVYQHLLEERNAVDFDDLIMKTTLLFKMNDEVRNRYIDRFDQILVDEYQDTNKCQYNLIKTLAQDKQNISVVGDEDQSIYGWRGADIQNILSFEKDFGNPKIIKLEQNYRSTQLILDAAHSVINKNTERREKKLWSEKKQGPNITIYEAQNEVDEAKFIVETIKELQEEKNYAVVDGVKIKDYKPAYGDPSYAKASEGEVRIGLKDICVLYRANAQSRAIEEQFLRAKIPYKLVGGQRFYDRKEIKDVLAYLRLFYNPADSLSLLRVVNTPARGIGPKAITEIIETSKNLKLPVIDLLTSLALLDDYKHEVSDLEKTLAEQSPAEEEDNLFKQHNEQLANSQTGKLANSPDPFILSLKEFKDGLSETKLEGNKNIVSFGRKVNDLKNDLMDMKLTDFIKNVLERMDYLKHVSDGTKEGENRVENIKEFLSVASKYDYMSIEDGLSQFLEDVSLIEEAQERDEKAEKEAVTIMTIHASKGLEFDTVFVAGLEEGIFPHSRSLADPREMEEERRLAYVAITRAKVNLFLLYAVSRQYFGNYQSNLVSRFIADIPSELIDFKNSNYGSGFDDAPASSYVEDTGGHSEEYEYIDIGDQVKHAKFGIGKIIDIEADSVTVDFEDQGRTKLMKEFAKLTKV
jgi:DNA helicase II / ATP-dependent DNA helicase PcrA